MRIGAGALALLLGLSACTEPEPVPPSRNVSVVDAPAPPASATPKTPISDTTEPEPIVLPPSNLPVPPGGVRLHRYDPAAIRAADAAATPCRVERSATPLPIPADMEFAGTSPDGSVELYVDEGFRGGDHNIGDEITAIVEGRGSRVIARLTEDGVFVEDIRVTVDTDLEYGIGLAVRGGELSCGTSISIPANLNQSRFTVGVADAPGEPEEVWGYGGSYNGCLTVQDMATSRQYLAVFTDPPDGRQLYRKIHGLCRDMPLASHVSWTPCRPTRMEGVRIALPERVCKGAGSYLTEGLVLTPETVAELGLK